MLSRLGPGGSSVEEWECNRSRSLARATKSLWVKARRQVDLRIKDVYSPGPDPLFIGSGPLVIKRLIEIIGNLKK